MEIDVAEIPPLAGFTGKERDVETGLDYFGARYYESWSARWLSVDPMAKKYPGWSPYNYVGDDPSLLVDLNGMNPGDNNNQGSQSSPNWNWQFGPNGTYVLFNAGSSSQQQQTVTLAGPEEFNPSSISANGFSQDHVSAVSHAISILANSSVGAASIVARSGLVMVFGGLFTDGTSVLAGGALLRGAAYLELGSATLRFANYEIFHVGNGNQVGLQFGKAMVDAIMSQGTHEIEKALETPGLQAGKFSLSEQLVKAVFGGAFGDFTPSQSASSGPTYAVPDVTMTPY